MSLERINTFVHEMVMGDGSLSDPRDCRNSSIKIADKVKKEFPRANVTFMAYPEAREGEGIHYSILIAWENRKMIINLVKAPGFPVYIGDLDYAVPTFSAMKQSDTVL